MKREVIIAILIGLFLGLIITYGFYQARLALNKSSSQQDIEQSVSPTPADKNTGKLAIHSPEDETIQSEKNLTVTGNTQASSFVVIFVNDKEKITTADQSGNFSAEVTLNEGSNVITIFALDEDGNSAQEEKVVIVTTESF